MQESSKTDFIVHLLDESNNKKDKNVGIVIVPGFVHVLKWIGGYCKEKKFDLSFITGKNMSAYL